MDRYAVVGNPIAHSKSPLIHAQFAQKTGQSLEYTRIESPIDGFSECIKTFFDQGGKGLNVTVPFKEDAWRLCSELSERAQLAGAVNTLFLDPQGKLCGENTDGIGLVNDLKQNGFKFQGKKILVIGAGGAVRGVLQPILNEQPIRLTISNRTLSKANALVDIFSSFGLVDSKSFEQLNEAYDLVINGTSASLDGALPNVSPGIFKSDTVVYDMMYAKEGTVFNHWAKQHGVEIAYDGLGMLVEQAAEAFFVWRGIRPETQEVIQLLRDA